MFLLLSNLPTTQIATSFQILPSRDQPGSLTPRKESDNGGKLDSINHTWLTEYVLRTDTTAVEIDSIEPRSLLEPKSVDPSMEEAMELGTL
jgi:hypothetical protein